MSSANSPSAPEASPLRVGVCVVGSPIAPWLSGSLREFQTQGVEFVQVTPYVEPKRKFLHRTFSRLESRVFKHVLKSTPPENNTPWYGESVEAGDAASSDLDLLICSGEHAESFTASDYKYGIWAVILSASGQSSETIPGFWESLEGLPVTESRLEASGQGQHFLLDRTFSPTYLLSPAVNLNSVACSAAAMLNRQLRKLLLNPADYSYAEREEISQFKADAGEPGIIDSLRFLVVQGVRPFLEYAHKRFYWDRWCMRYQLGTADFQEIAQPDDEFWADPHLVVKDDQTYLFFEVYTQARGIGHLSVLELKEDGSWSEPQEVLVKDHHLSYPHIVQANGQYYMIPETKAIGAIQLYVCGEFPHKWRFLMNLMEDVQAADSTVFWKDGLWWMFTCVTEGFERGCENTHLYYSEELESNHWTPHPSNPIVSDARAGRPAGEVYEEDGRWIRPVQNSSYDYGYGLSVYEICVLTKTEYKEQQIFSVFPERFPNSRGIHSWAKRADLTVIDSMERSARF